MTNYENRFGELVLEGYSNKTIPLNQKEAELMQKKFMVMFKNIVNGTISEEHFVAGKNATEDELNFLVGTLTSQVPVGFKPPHYNKNYIEENKSYTQLDTKCIHNLLMDENPYNYTVSLMETPMEIAVSGIDDIIEVVIKILED